MKLPPTLLVPIVLVVAAGGWFGYQWYAADAAVAAERAKLLDHIAIELAKDNPDSSELSLLVARIKEFEDHTTAPDLLAALTRIELERENVQRAYDLFAPVLGGPVVSPDNAALGATVLLRRQAAGMPDRGSSVKLLEEAIPLARQAYDDTGAPVHLLRCMLAAMRLSDKERAAQFGDRLLAENGGSAAAEFVNLVRKFSDTTARVDLLSVQDRIAEPVGEIDAMLALLELHRTDVETAAKQIERALGLYPGIIEVRVVAAAIFAAGVAGNAEGSPERQRWRVRRDAQLDWLLEHAAPDDPRREGWGMARQQG